MVMGGMRPRFFSIKAPLLFPKTPNNRKSIFLLSSPFLVTAFFCSPPFIFPKARPFLSEQSNSFTTIMSRASADRIAENYETPELQKPRHVVKKVLAKQQQEGDGAKVRRSIGRPELRNFDPFLLLDEFSVSRPAGFPDHPHRGFETVTYMLEGAFTHQDFSGHKGTISAGDLQWMTAGRGIVHSEMPAGDGVQKGLQLWINLSSKDKMVEPNYQELQSKDITRVNKNGVDVRIIAGEAFGVSSPIYTRTPTMYLDFTMKPGAELRQLIPLEWNAFVYIIDGDGVFGDEETAPVSSHHVLILDNGDGLCVWNKSGRPLRFVLVGG
ncbi:pirin-like protein, partial [Phalaenopsis equestris]|uniref:pirin-like protein n=1 Tax=Phalaenopsis equestris TaxID=78828 RepID=UPI0009E62D47